MTTDSLRRAAAHSAARQRKTDPAPLPSSPGWEVKSTPRGTLYRVITVPLDEYPRLMQEEGLEPKAFFYFAPESKPGVSPDPGWVLGVRKRGEREEKEL